MLGMAVALTSCSDDDDYIPGTPKAGVYFPNTVSSEIQILPTETSFDIPVDRVAGTPATATVSVNDPSGLFTVPATVSFDGDKLSTNLTITYDPAKLTLGETYKITITLSEGANVGISKSDFYLTFNPELITEKFEAGTGVYYYGNPWLEGLETRNAITYTYDPTKPDNRTFTIKEWGYEEEGYATPVTFTITCEDFTPNEDGVIIVSTPEMDCGILNGGKTPVNFMDVQAWGSEMLGLKLDPAEYPYSYYDPETGTFYMSMIYYAGDKPADGSYYYLGTEIFQMDGYPVYSIGVTYNNMVTDRDGNATANCTITPGPDVASVKAILVAGEDPNVGVSQILQGAAGVVEYPYAESIDANFNVTEGGYYTVVAVSYSADGEPQEADYDTFQIYMGANPDADWEEIGNADYADGWVVASFSSGNTPLDPMEWVYSVPLRKHKTEANVYRLDNPYGSGFPLADYNAYPARRNIIFSVLASDMVIFEPQACGFGSKGFGSEMIIGNFEGDLTSQGATPDEIRGVFEANPNYKQYQSYYEEGQVVVPLPQFASKNAQTGKFEFGYNWNNVQPTVVFMPETSSEVRAKVKAASIAKPKINGLRMNSSKTRTVRAVLNHKINNGTKMLNHKFLRNK